MMDTLDNAKKELRELYAETSKHGQYQTIPDRLAGLLGIQFEVNEEWRGDRPRYPLIKQFIQDAGCRSVLDVGANTGFFALSLAGDIPALKVKACELNKTHARIIELLARMGGYEVSVTDQPADLEHAGAFGSHDCALHLNILHHAGHDFDADHVKDRKDHRDYAVNYLRAFRGTARSMVYQMGYNWKGDKTLPLIAKEDQAGKVRYTMDIFQASGWIVEGVAFARNGTGAFPIEYDRFHPNDLPAGDAALQAWLTERYGEAVWSEFYQRPLWFCRSAE
jgi:SAM-dependent methyltransferase